MRFSLLTLFVWTAIVAVYLAFRPFYYWSLCPATMAALTSAAVAYRARKRVLLWATVTGGLAAAAAFAALCAEVLCEMFPEPPDREDRAQIAALLWHVAAHYLGYYALAGTIIGACVGGSAWALRRTLDAAGTRYSVLGTKN